MKRRHSDEKKEAKPIKKTYNSVTEDCNTRVSPPHTSREAFAILYEATQQRWQLLYEIMVSNELPLDIATVITRFMLLYNCIECNIHVKCLPFASVCIPCHRANNTSGVLCNACVGYIADHCYSCDYTVCRAHTAINTDPVQRCDWCSVLLCERCQNNKQYGNITIDYNKDEHFVLCRACVDLQYTR